MHMWFLYAVAAQLALVSRRTTEKSLSAKIDHSMMAWLQQFMALPFIIALLPLATFYNPFGLSKRFYLILLIYVITGAFDLILYYKALSVGDVSVVLPVITLSSASVLVGSYFLLGQRPSTLGLVAVALVLIGVFLCVTKRAISLTATNNRYAIICALIIVAIRGFNGPVEVLNIRETNPIYYNFLSSLLTVPVVMCIVLALNKMRSKSKMEKLKSVYVRHKTALLIIGLTYAINMTLTYYAKVMSPNAAYVTSIKSASVLPMVFIGALFFREHISKRQWAGVAIIMIGLLTFAIA